MKKFQTIIVLAVIATTGMAAVISHSMKEHSGEFEINEAQQRYYNAVEVAERSVDVIALSDCSVVDTTNIRRVNELCGIIAKRLVFSEPDSVLKRGLDHDIYSDIHCKDCSEDVFYIAVEELEVYWSNVDSPTLDTDMFYDYDRLRTILYRETGRRYIFD